MGSGHVVYVKDFSGGGGGMRMASIPGSAVTAMSLIEEVGSACRVVGRTVPTSESLSAQGRCEVGR